MESGSPAEEDEEQAAKGHASVRKSEKPWRGTEKGALLEDYSLLAHQFIAHLCRVHPSKPRFMMKVKGFLTRYWSRQQIRWLNCQCRSITFTAECQFTTTNSFSSGIKSSLNVSLALFPGLQSGVKKPWTGFSRWNLRGQTVRADRNPAYYAVFQSN